MRVQGAGAKWCNFLIRLGNGEMQDSPGNVGLPTELMSGGDISGQSNYHSKNFDSLEISSKVLRRLPGEEEVYRSTDEVVCGTEADANNFPVEFLNSSTPQGYPPHELFLKNGAIVMLLRNRVTQGLCNGTRLIVRHTSRHVLGCQIATESNKDSKEIFNPARTTHFYVG
ncbi:hypothetical protein ANCCAN_15740 [Ancylostoma caninum]|uniref:DNA helicase Pif1-like 2B domain-containing protein n=1 Tax=Ancylostoma caninum TaxID=29170 RepID=A0A368G1M4_ANCCA|nr:hypothetical protein ANCCAN_15740 [Ancylostoma caninum]